MVVEPLIIHQKMIKPDLSNFCASFSMLLTCNYKGSPAVHTLNTG